MVTLKYVTELELNQFINMDASTKDRNVGSDPVQETVGTGDGTTTTYYLDHQFIINDTDELYAGTTLLVRDTDYAITNDTGKVVLTSSGTTKLGSGTLYADYNYNSVGIKDIVINLAIAASEDTIESETNSTFVDGTGSTPGYGLVTDEYKPGKGVYNKYYFTNYQPVVDINTTLTGTVSHTGTILGVSSTDGFPKSGVVVIETEQISYSNKTGTTLIVTERGYNSTSAGTHTGSTGVYSTVVEVSFSDEGTEPSWNTLIRNTDYDLDTESGRVYIYDQRWTTSAMAYYNRIKPIADVPHRLRVRYLYGYDSVPDEIKRATLMLAARQLRMQTMSKALIDGRNEFKPATIDVDLAWVQETLNDYRKRQSDYI